MKRVKIAGLFGVIVTAAVVAAQQNSEKPKTGIPAVQVSFESLKPSATFKVGATADWVLVSDGAVWVAGSGPYSVQRIDPATNRIVAKVTLPGEACSGLAFGFGSVWAPVCGAKPLLARIDAHTNRIAALLPVGPAGPEGGIAPAATASGW